MLKTQSPLTQELNVAFVSRGKKCELMQLLLQRGHRGLQDSTINAKLSVLSRFEVLFWRADRKDRTTLDFRPETPHSVTMERVVEFFVVAVKPQQQDAEMTFAYPRGSDDEREFCESVAMFMFPPQFGADCDETALLSPPPVHNLFALTDANGDHLYGASICFHETTADADCSDRGDALKTQGKAICLLSKRPFYTALLRYLERLFLLGVHQTYANQSEPAFHGVEKALCNIFHEVPVPHRGLAVQLQIADVDIVLERPHLHEFPFEMDPELMTYAFMAVDPRVLVQLYHHVLLEHRILIVGNDAVQITAIVETIKSLIFPFTWLHVIIPTIPDALDLSTLLEAPVPFIAGANVSQLEGTHIPSNVVKLQFVGGKFMLDQADLALPVLPSAALRVLMQMANIRLPDQTALRKECHETLWDRRVQLQKWSLLEGCGSSNMSSMPVITPKMGLFVRQSMLYKKMMKLFLEITTELLQDYPVCITHAGDQTQLEVGRFVERKPACERAFYHDLVQTALFQSFIAQHNEHMNGNLPQEQAMKLEFVHQRLLSTANSESLAANVSNKTFVAHTPQGQESSAMTTNNKERSVFMSPPTSNSKTHLYASVLFPDIDMNAFGTPRKVVFPTLSNDVVTSSLGTLMSSNSAHDPSKELLGIEWMQLFLKNVSMPTPLQKKPELLPSITSFTQAAAFKRSRTIDRLKAGSPFYRTMTQRFENSSATLPIRQKEPIAPTRAPPVIQSIWLVTTSACTCKIKINGLTERLTQAISKFGKEATATSEIYCELIDELAACGHATEAKAVFEECISSSPLVTLETLAQDRYFWKPFSSLVRCYVMNGLVQRAFDLLVRVKMDDEQQLDPTLLGSLRFDAHVLNAEKDVVLERITVMFSYGNLGLCLAPREGSVGCEVIAFQSPDECPSDPKHQMNDVDQAAHVTHCVGEHDIIESVNGQVVIHNSFADIVTCLKQAHRPMTVTLLRGVNGVKSLMNVASHATNAPESTASVGSQGPVSATTASRMRPRKDFCDRFGLLPQHGIRITALADCDSCGARLSYTEIHDGWSLTDANDYTTRCALCQHRFVPRLCIMLGVSNGYVDSAEEDSVASHVHVEQIEYLSMPVIRKELTNLSQKISLTMLSMGDLRRLNPRIYWNIVVKLLSLACPLDFLDLPDTAIHTPEKQQQQQCCNNDRDPVGNEKHPTSQSRKLALEQLIEQTLKTLRTPLTSVSLPEVAQRLLHDLEVHLSADNNDDEEEEAEDDDEVRRSCRTMSLDESSCAEDGAECCLVKEEAPETKATAITFHRTVSSFRN